MRKLIGIIFLIGSIIALSEGQYEAMGVGLVAVLICFGKDIINVISYIEYKNKRFAFLGKIMEMVIIISKSFLAAIILFFILCGTGIMSGYIGDVDVSVVEVLILYVISHIFLQFGEPKLRQHRQEVRLGKSCNAIIERINNIINQHNCNKVTATYISKYYKEFDEVYTYLEIRCMTENINLETIYSEKIQLSEKISIQETKFIKEKIKEKFPNRFIDGECRNREEFLLLTAGLFKTYKQKYDREEQEKLRRKEEEQRKQYIRERQNIPL